MKYSLTDIAEITLGKLLHLNKDVLISKLVYDSRIAGRDDSSLFVALIGNIDGHAFIEDAYLKGIRSFMISKLKAYRKLPDAIVSNSNFILVKDSLQAIQALGAFHRKQFNNNVLGITGSNGKTIVKEWLYHLMYPDKNIHRSPKSFNSQLGVPLSVLGLEQSHDLGIIEAGISVPGEMAALEKVIQPDLALFTNIGLAHQEGFACKEEKIQEKLKLFRHAKVIFYCLDHKEVHAQIKKLKDHSFFRRDASFLNWGNDQKADLRIISVDTGRKYTEIKAVYEGKQLGIHLPFQDRASIENAIHCWLVLLFLRYGNDIIAKRMSGLSHIEMRLELKEGINNCTIINDTYNSDLNSLTIALDVLNQQNQHKTKTLILSDIFQSGRSDESLYKEVAGILEQKGVDKFIGIGKSIYAFRELFNSQSDFYSTVDHYLDILDPKDFNDEAILVKGARVFQFEKIVKKLQKKVHNTVLEINLQQVVNNLNAYRRLLEPETKIMAMVKAFSYGSGSFEIANVLQYQNVDYLAVAYPDEGADLRKNGISLPIMVMNPDPESFALILSENLEPEIYSFRILQKLIEECKSGFFKQEINIHIKVETGMNRLGFAEEDLGELLNILNAHPYLKIKSVFSHLVSSDFAGHDDFSRKQIVKFKSISEQIESQLSYPVLKHILNSAGITRFKDAQMDMVRLGLGLYGIDTSNVLGSEIQSVSTFKTYISQIKIVKPGETVGYMRNGKVDRLSRVATIGVGYADGFPRILGNGRGEVLINNRKARVIGNVCMDMCMIDITEIEAEEGDEVIIFGNTNTISEMAERASTIPYEILTNVSQRVKRVYYKE